MCFPAGKEAKVLVYCCVFSQDVDRCASGYALINLEGFYLLVLGKV